jgi:hypothetical protein
MTQFVDSLTRFKQERELKKAKKKIRKDLTPKVGAKEANRLVKIASKRVMANREAIPFENKAQENDN